MKPIVFPKAIARMCRYESLKPILKPSISKHTTHYITIKLYLPLRLLFTLSIFIFQSNNSFSGYWFTSLACKPDI